MLATSVPVDVVPSAPRWPSWKIHTNAPTAAVSNKTLSTNAFSGNTTLPVSRNNSTNEIAAMTPNTSGSLDVIAAALSRLICASPVTCTDLPPGGATACTPSSWASEASVNSGAVLPMVSNALASFIPVAAGGGPGTLPSTNVPPGADTADTSVTRDSDSAYWSSSAGGKPTASGMTTVTLVDESTAKLLRSSSPTCRADSDCGSTRSSGKPHLIPRNGAPSSSSRATIARPAGIDRRITNLVDRYQNICSTGLRSG